ncbi:MAG: hypothetical protein ACYCWW_06300 [Deltaproteobacteria bacterium]
MNRLSLIAAPLLVAGCLGNGRPDNERAKERIFTAHPVEPPEPWQLPIDAAKLDSDRASAARALSMGEDEAAHRLSSFVQRGTLALTFRGPGQTVTLGEERLVEQSTSGDLHLRLLESSGNGMELVVAAGRVYGRNRYGPFVEREMSEEIRRQRDEVFGTLGTLYRLADHALKLSRMGSGHVSGRSCERYDLSLGTPDPSQDSLRFTGRLDADTEKRFAFLYDRRLEALSGSLCVDRETGVVLEAKLRADWSAAADAGVSQIHVELTQSLERAGQPIAIEAPPSPLPPPHRPHGPAATLAKYGYSQAPDAGSASLGTKN